MPNVISINAIGENFVVQNPSTDKTATMTWLELSNIAPKLKYRHECIIALLEAVGASAQNLYEITDCAESLIVMATYGRA